MENSNPSQPSIEDLVRRVLQSLGDSMASTSASAATPLTVSAVPEFSGEDLGDDAKGWCDRVEEITKEVPKQRLSLATHALTGRAKTWYKRWDARPCTWEKFREDLCAVFVAERKLHDRMLRALQYTSDTAVGYADYARTKLLYLKQTGVSFTEKELTELIISTISDVNVRQAMLNARFNATSELLVGIADYRKVVATEDGKRQIEKHSSQTSKRCYSCNEYGHTARRCTRQRKDRSRSPLRRSPPRQGSTTTKRGAPTCTYCSKRGHEEVNCWAKRRANRDGQVPKKFDTKDKNQVNVCYSVIHKPSAILLEGLLVENCLLDNGAACSIVQESVAKRANCRIVPRITTLRGLGDSATVTIGGTTAMVQIKDVSAKANLYVVPDRTIPYDVIVGKNFVVGKGLRMVTDSDGTTTVERGQVHTEEAPAADPLCYAVDQEDPRTKEAVAAVLGRYQHMLASGSNVRRVSTGEMSIVTKEDRVVSYHPYRLSFVEREKVRGIIDELLANEIIRESTSPYTSPIILVKKKNGEERMCVDFRALNKITVKDRFPLPLIEDQLDRLGTGKYFTTLDMASGFYQVPIAENSITKTAFVTPDGHYEFLRMPFGLTNAPAVFQRAVNKALGNLRYKFALVYLDDILIPSETVQEGLERLERVLHALDVAGFSLNLKKCKFFQTTIEYLGREVSAEGIRPGAAKINSLLEAPVPENVRQVRQFMGLASYFRKFIPEFATRTACVTKLTKQDVPWCWGNEQEEARRYILEKLCSKPLLVIFDPTRETELHTDASALDYGAILFQRLDNEWRVVAYFSRRTTTEESRYHSYELETLAIVNALKHFRAYLLGINFKIITDCNAVKATGTKKDLVPRVARWWIFLQDYSFELEFRKGKHIEHVDYLSRNPRKDYRVNLVCEGSWLEAAQRNDVETREIIEKLNSGHSLASDYELRQGILCHLIKDAINFDICKETYDTLNYTDASVIPDAVLVEDNTEDVSEVMQDDTKFREIVDIDYKKRHKLLRVGQEQINCYSQYVLEQFNSASDRSLPIHDLDLKRWALKAREVVHLPSQLFTASSKWIYNFKIQHGIVLRKINKFVTQTHILNKAELLEQSTNYAAGEVNPYVARPQVADRGSRWDGMRRWGHQPEKAGGCILAWHPGGRSESSRGPNTGMNALRV
ncbi:LOW QUALITY PROTEIN: uncharacterized protein LOC122403183 [Colletes gigas]|uniref:LOW QUALITY PROTEIN: uncharacterized protein LOC122403183 n=1 Tax=Colletes gigas TaxID=935657 RepID=UPI001C9AE0BE|nr:LOW QUALITY PROTEIN: uncharacterized protein LOC122403183 [Colletes gigas]